MATAHEQEIDSLSHLEERIQRAVALVNRLRQDKDAAMRELASTKDALEDSQNNNARLSEEVESLRTERQHVRSRIEKLLGHIDELGAA
jgi:FtsZ-binding cell division protein ZapB